VMRVKQDAIPGMTVPVWFEAKETGQFEIACAQLCGLGHYRMKGFFTVETDEEFDEWMAEQAAASSFEDDYY
jgi:cytochrome c oxidase subunit 2